MKRINLLTAILFLSIASIAQVTYRTIPDTPAQIAPYDSLENIPHTSLKSLYGQTALILDTIYFHPAMNSFATFRGTDIINNHFNIVTAQRDNKRRQIWITMASKSDTIYYQLTGNSLEHSTFVTLGYYEKQKQLYSDKTFQLRLDGQFKELKTGQLRTFTSSDKFTCTGVSIIHDGHYLIPTFLLKNSKGKEIAVPFKGFEKSSEQAFWQFSIK